MTKRMLIDATHPEETRVAVIDGTYLEELDVETAQKEQIKGNIYLAKVIRTEPSLQAAFVEYGGNRHGFLAFSEIHPDYYQIPVADKEKLKEMLEEERKSRQRRDDDNHEIKNKEEIIGDVADKIVSCATCESSQTCESASNTFADKIIESDVAENNTQQDSNDVTPVNVVSHDEISENIQEIFNVKPDEVEAAPAFCATPAILVSPINDVTDNVETPVEPATEEASVMSSEEKPAEETTEEPKKAKKPVRRPRAKKSPKLAEVEKGDEIIETNESDNHQEIEDVSGFEDDDIDNDIKKTNILKNYKIQEVIKKGQVLLIQVLKEERGNKGAALTTYLSLAGRYCVLMPNTAHGGGVSRKITNVSERKQLKQILAELEIPEAMGVIVRTAGKDKSKDEIKKDYDYLIRTWTSIRDKTMQAQAPALIHEEANLVKRALRDLYSKEIDEIIISGEKEYKYAKDFMKMLAPQMVKKITSYKNNKLPLFNRYQVESQIAMIHSPIIQLKSGGYLVMNQTEALVAIDINSGRATKEKTIEETALKTNLEAADEIARQLRLRDLSGLVVIDFIDMDEQKNNHAVERRMKEAMKKDKARVQVGRISGFGLMEMSRQRMHSSFLEASYNPCPHCNGTGLIRSVASCALAITRIIEEEVYKNQVSKITVTVHPDVALYILNHKRDIIVGLENSYKISIIVLGDASMNQGMDYRIEKLKTKKQEDQEEVIDTVDADENIDTAEEKTPKENPRKQRRSGGKRNNPRREKNQQETEEKPAVEQSSIEATVDDNKEEHTSDNQVSEDGNNNPRKKRNRNNRNFYKNRGKYNKKRRDNDGGDVANTNQSTHPSAPSDNNAGDQQKEKKKGWWQKLIN